MFISYFIRSAYRLNTIFEIDTISLLIDRCSSNCFLCLAFWSFVFDTSKCWKKRESRSRNRTDCVCEASICLNCNYYSTYIDSSILLWPSSLNVLSTIDRCSNDQVQGEKYASRSNWTCCAFWEFESICIVDLALISSANELHSDPQTSFCFLDGVKVVALVLFLLLDQLHSI